MAHSDSSHRIEASATTNGHSIVPNWLSHGSQHSELYFFNTIKICSSQTKSKQSHYWRVCYIVAGLEHM